MLKNIILSCCLTTVWLLIPLQSAEINVFFAGGQSNAKTAWADAITAELVADPAYDNVVMVHVNHSGNWLQNWYTEAGAQANFESDFFNDSNTGALETALSAITAAGDSYVISGFFWFQGEGDTGSTTDSDAYPSRFLAMLNQIKADAGLDYDIPFTLAVIDANPGYETQLAVIGRTYADVDYLRNIQQNILAVAGNNGTSVDTRGYGRSDVWHLTTAELESLGPVMAQQHIATFGPPPPVVLPPWPDPLQTYIDDFDAFTIGAVSGQNGWAATIGTPEFENNGGGDLVVSGTAPSAELTQGETGAARNTSLFSLGRNTDSLVIDVRMHLRYQVSNTLSFVDSSGNAILKFGGSNTGGNGFVLGDANLGNPTGDNMLPGSGSSGAYAWYDVRLTVDFNGAAAATGTLQVDKDGGASEEFETVALNQDLNLAPLYEDPIQWTGLEFNLRFADAQQGGYQLHAFGEPFAVT